MAATPITQSSEYNETASSARLYFAYGSNLHLRQMQRRCPGSRYIGHARLADYRWQINERGYANVVPCQGQWVDGLVYEIGEADEAKLDINEGVSKKAYIKTSLTVLVHLASSSLYRRSVSWIVSHGGPAQVIRQTEGQGLPLLTCPSAWKHEALVYVSEQHMIDSEPKAEYVVRLNRGIGDATALGVDEDYILNCVRPFIPQPEGRMGVEND